MVMIEKAKREYQHIPIDLIKSPMKPSREIFEDINTLARTIQEHGLLQPIIVKQSDGAYGFEVVIGERRLRACRKAGLAQIPCIVLDGISEEQILQMQLTENLQRADLKVFEEIRIVESLKDNYNLPNDEIAIKIGLSASTVSNYLTIAKGLSEQYVRMIEKGKGRTHSRQAFTLGKALILAQNQLPTDKIKENVELIQKKGLTTAQLSKKLAKQEKRKIKRVLEGRKFWKELTRSLKDFSRYWSDFVKLKEWESVDAFHLTLSVTMPKDLDETEET